MNIQIGAKLSIILKGRKEFLPAYFVGERYEQHIVITLPEQKTSCIKKIRNHDEVFVRYTGDGVRYEFRSNVIESLNEPVELVVLEYPVEIYPINKRRSERINCLVSAKLKNKSGSFIQWVVGVIENINKTGCLCIFNKTEGSKMSFNKGDEVILKCQFPGLVGEQNAEGKVVRIRQEKKGTVMGIHFDEKVWWIPPYEQK